MNPLLRIAAGVIGMVFVLSPIVVAMLWRANSRLRDSLKYKEQLIGEDAVIIQELQTSFKSEADRAQQYFSSIRTFEDESKRWRDLYWKQSREHGNAQSRLMSERDRNFRLLRGNKITPYVDPVIEQLVGAFREEHVETSRLVEISGKITSPEV